jgi:hypothetical protein
MLTPNDVHLLVGLLTQASSPDNVAVELGSLVYDTAAEKLRDVDITVDHPIGEIRALKGLEVKKHKDPLDVTHVEQLAMKLGDMPSLTSRQIVSASGYTAAAIKKAAAHDLELLKLTNWDPKKYSFEHAQFSGMSAFSSRSLHYVDGPHIHIEVERAGCFDGDPALIQVTDEEGRPHSSGLTFAQFKNNIVINATNELSKTEQVSTLSGDATKAVSVWMDFSDHPYLKTGDVIVKIKGARIQGVLCWKETPCEAQYKVLVDETTDRPIIGCALAELPNGNLIGITASSADRTIRLITVAVSVRNLAVIREMQLGKG